MTRAANRPEDSLGRQYHIGLARGDVARSIILCGDLARAEVIAGRFDSINAGFPKRSREYITYTGRWKSLDVTVMATGMGCDNTEIAVMELLAIVDRPDFVRVGSCGALQPEIELGDVVISTGAMRLESTSAGFVEESYPAIASHEMVLALTTAAARAGVPFHVGMTATAAGFYGWQGRTPQVIEPRYPDLPDRLRSIGVKNFEMEASTLFVLASLRGLRAGAVCGAYANRPRNAFVDETSKHLAERHVIAVGMGALEVLAEMDRTRGSKPWFTV